MTEVTFKNKTRFVVLIGCLIIVFGIFFVYSPQVTSLDPQIAAKQKAENQIRDQNYREALNILLPAAKQYPHDAEIRYKIAVSYHGLGDVSTAMNQYSAALAIDPYHAGSLVQLGRYYAQIGQMGLAQQMLARLQSLCQGGRNCGERDLLATDIQKRLQGAAIARPHKN